MLSLVLIKATAVSLVLSAQPAPDPPPPAGDPADDTAPAATPEVPEAPPAPAAPEPTTISETAEPTADHTDGAATGKMVTLTFLGGGGLALEDGLDDAPYGVIAFGLDIDPAQIGLFVGGTFRYSQHRQGYTVRQPVVANAAGFGAEDPIERWLDTRITIAYNVLHTVTDAADLRIGFAPRIVQFLADGFDSWFFSPEGYLSLRVPVTERFDLDAAFGFAANATGAEETRSIQGLPQFLYDYSAGLSVDLGSTRLVSLELRWQGHTIVYELTERWYQGALAGIRIGI